MRDDRDPRELGERLAALRVDNPGRPLHELADELELEPADEREPACSAT